jgi:hypothetical protein
MMFLLAVSCAPDYNALCDANVTSFEDPAGIYLHPSDPMQLLRSINRTLASHFWYPTMPEAVEDIMACHEVFGAFHLTIAVS